MPALLLDENVRGTILSALRRPPSAGGEVVDVVQVGEPGAPPKGTPDPVLLIWCEANDRSTMPGHFHDHMAAGRHSPGVLLIRRRWKPSEVIVELGFLAVAGEPDDFRDLIQYIPLR